MERRSFLGLAVTAAVATACRGPSPRTSVPSPHATELDPYARLRGFTAETTPPSPDEYVERQMRVRAALQSTGTRALVVEPGPNMIYLAGVHWGRSERPFLAVLPADGELSWVCPAFEERKAREQLGPAVTIRTVHEHEDPFAAAAEAVGHGEAAIAVDPDARAFVYQGLAGHVSTHVDGRAVLGARVHKTTAELARLRRANEATKAAIALVAKGVRPGIRQSELAARLVAAQEAAGLGEVWALVLFGPAAAFPHGTREDRALAPGELVLVDTGGSLHGYRSDVSRTWSIDRAGDEERRAWEAVVLAQAAALERIRAGGVCSEPDAAARTVIARAGFGAGYERFTHRLGHGIGLQVHEDPYLRPGNAEVLEPGMTMSNEPGIYVPDRFGVRIEDIVVVTDGAPEVLGAKVGPWDDPFAGHLPPSDA